MEIDAETIDEGPINWLPGDLILEIFSYLDAASLSAAGLACKTWASLIGQSETLWKTKTQQILDRDAQRYIIQSKSEGNSWKESFQMNYGSNLIRSKWKRGMFSQPKAMLDLPPKVLCPMTADTWGEIFQMELER
ncbi:F-box only protein 48-like [Haliotis rufescens]|uniref:F-box only protein 48-like n=1 Tax=Haliotis rufescens TaxID=6454 RepID=UPI00201F73A2|nr:F-box only protein 48-like [Haliotis rufescens]